MIPVLLTLRAEMYKGFLLLWRYRFNSVAELVTMFISFIAIGLLVGQGEMDAVELAPLMLGYLVWFFGMAAISNMSFNLMEEARAGTMEQMFMSPVPMGVIVMGRVFAMMVTAIAQVVILGIALIFFLKIPIPMRPAGIPIFAITVLGLLGFGFVMGGITLIYKQVFAIVGVLQNGLVFMTGAIVPITVFPGWLQFVTKLIPSTQGIIVLRKVVLDGQSLLSTWQDGSLLLLIANSGFYFVGGWLFFIFCEHLAKKQGTLGQY